MKNPKSLTQSLNDVKYEQYINNLHDRLPQLVDPSDIDCKRWPWELIQNAKDTVVKRVNPRDRYVDVKIRLYVDSNGNKKLEFEHNGDQFTNKAITGLIWKFSAEKRNEQTTEDGLTRDKQSTGRFGTGFMTTHALSLTVDVSGSLFHDDPDVNCNVSVDFTLHREGPDDDAYKQGVDLTEKELEENMGNRPIPDGQVLPTKFTYHLNKESSEKAAQMGIDNVRANGAQTMLFCSSVRSIQVVDEIHDFNFKITRKNSDERKNVVKEIVFIEESSDRNEPVVRRFISKEIEEYSEAISSHCNAKGRNLRLNVAVEVDKDNNILPIPSTSPSVFCSLPLIGFEWMTLPFYINSNDFEPTTERTSLYLKKKRLEYRTNEDTGTEETYYLQSGVNWSIFERSLPLFEEIVDYLVENGYNQRYNLVNGLNGIFKGGWETETKNCLASRFVLSLRDMLAGKELIKTLYGYRSIKSGVKLVECAKYNDLHALYRICGEIYGENLAIEEENGKWVAQKWNRFDFDSDFDEKKPDGENPAFPTIKYDEIADYIERAENIEKLQIISLDETKESNASVYTKKLEWLNDFYEWIKSSKNVNLSKKKIVPNRLGQFCSIEQGCGLKDASEIPTSVFDFMKKIGLDWDEFLLMEGVQHITLEKETKDNVVIEINKRSKEICTNADDSDDDKLSKLLPHLLALPSNENGKAECFLKKRKQIVSILRIMYADKCKDREPVTLELNSGAWGYADGWFMKLVASTIALHKRLDVITDNDTEETRKSKYCTSGWLSDTLDFLFRNSYLHQEDIMSKEGRNDTLALIPNRYGDFYPLNELYKQGTIPEELLDDKLKCIGYDAKKKLLNQDFVLYEKLSISDLTISTLAEKYTTFFAGEANEEDKLAVAKYLIHLKPECGDPYKETREICDLLEKVKDDEKIAKAISTSDLTVWKGANDYLIKHLCSKVSELGSLDEIGKAISETIESDQEGKELFSENGLKWLNSLIGIKRHFSVEIDEGIKLIPDWNGLLHAKGGLVFYNGNILAKYTECHSLIGIVGGILWESFLSAPEEKQEGDDTLIESIVHPHYTYVHESQNNTDERLFGLVDRLVYYSSEHYSSESKSDLKKSIRTLLAFFDANECTSVSHTRNDDNLQRLFPKTYKMRKSLAYDFIYDAETKARFSQINDNYTPGEVEILLENKDLVKGLLQNKDLSAIKKIVEEFPKANFESILNILRREQGDFNTDRLQQNISEERKREIGDKGECYIYGLLCDCFGENNIEWSNYAPSDKDARIVKFNGRDFRLKTTCHEFDFKVTYNGKTLYIEVKTTVGNVSNSKDFPLIFERKEWEWIDSHKTSDSLHYIVRVFDIEGTPKAYFLRQEQNIEKK